MFLKILSSKLVTLHPEYGSIHTDAPNSAQKNSALEVLRGSAALIVLVGHLYSKINGLPQISLLKYLLNWGTEAVIIFFILSGFVIRLSQERRARSLRQFMVDRLIRLYPLYLIVVLFSFWVALIRGAKVTIPDLFGNLLFLQSLQADIVGVFPTNEALWSLSFEMTFYFLFALTLLHKRWFSVWIFLSSLSVAIYSLKLPIHWLNHFKIILAFSAIWLLGYAIALYRDRFKFDLNFALSILPLSLVVARTSFISEYYDIYRLAGFSLFCLPLFNAIASSAKVKIKISPLIIWSICFLVLSLHWWLSNSHISTKILLSVFSIAGLLLANYADLLLRSLQPLRASIVYIASISYALYVIHMPILYLLQHFIKKQPLLVCALTVLLTFSIAHLFELILQPKLSRFLKKSLG
jgi:peptidoglycan/LPS O-acetylase OafA/YrhL